MAISFQYNKTSQQGLEKQLKVRERALPTLKNKESALRAEVKRAKDRLQELDSKLAEKLVLYDDMARLWCEFDASLVSIKDVKLRVKKIAGVQIPELEEVLFETAEYSLFVNPVWFADGIAIVKELATIGVEKEVYHQKVKRLDFARKKTTQKVNLYEKVQIHG